MGGVIGSSTGASIGAARGRKVKVNQQSVTNTTLQEINSTAVLSFINTKTHQKIMKTITCNTIIAKHVYTLNFKNENEVLALPSSPAIPEISSSVSSGNNIPSDQDIAAEIRKYKLLFDDGVITQEEFEAKKKQLLGLM